MNPDITESQLTELIRKGCEFTSDKYDSPVARYSKVDFSMGSYMGLKLFMADKSVTQSSKLKGMRYPDGSIVPIRVIRG